MLVGAEHLTVSREIKRNSLTQRESTHDNYETTYRADTAPKTHVTKSGHMK